MQTKICSRCKECKSINEFYNKRYWCKQCDKINTIIRQAAFKEICIKYKGGKCEKCNYDKYMGALQFHHRDPKQKDFCISNARLKTFNDEIKYELDKCDLLCANCHFEAHMVYEIEKIKEEWSFLSGIKKDKKETKLLCECGESKTRRASRCKKCYNKNSMTRNVDEVINKIKETNFVQAGKFFNVTDNALRKFLKSKGINPKDI